MSANAESSPFAGTPLLQASYNGQLACMQVLLDAGADINRPDCHGVTALYCAAWKGNLAAINCLLERGAVVNCRNRSGKTPLLAACRNGHRAVVAALLKAAAHPRMAARRETPLYLAALRGDVEMVDSLLAAGADPLEDRGILLCFIGRIPRAIAQKKRDSATDVAARERYANIVQRLQQLTVAQRPGKSPSPVLNLPQQGQDQETSC